MKSRKRKKTTPTPVEVSLEANPLQENPLQEVAEAHYEPAILLSQIEVVYNSRKSFDAASLSELAQSIAHQGLLQPISLMQKEASYVLVAGERRFRACRELGHPTIAALVRPWDEEAFLSLQLVENLQREDLPPLEEAEAFAHMLAEGHSMTELVAVSGKSRSFVEKRLQLTSLVENWKTALQDGSLSLSSALEIARLPQASQILLYTLTGESLSEDGYSARHLSAMIERRILLNLSRAVFDKSDAGLLPVAGSCLQCQKRTTCQQYLFTDYQADNDQCLDGACYNEKIKQHYLQLLSTIRAEYPNLVLVSYYTHNSFPYPDVISNGQWQRASQDSEGAFPALRISAHSIEIDPDIFYVTLGSEQKAIQEKPSRSQAVREGRIKNQTKLLVYEGLLEKDRYRLIDYYLKESLPTNKATIEWLMKEQGFSQPDFESYDYKKREQWVIDNTCEWTFEEKVFLYLTLKLRNGLHDKHNTHVREVARFLDYDFQPYMEKATELVDAPKPKKEKKGKEAQQERADKTLTTTEAPGADELPSRLRLKARTKVQPQNAA